MSCFNIFNVSPFQYYCITMYLLAALKSMESIVYGLKCSKVLVLLIALNITMNKRYMNSTLHQEVLKYLLLLFLLLPPLLLLLITAQFLLLSIAHYMHFGA